MMVGLVSSSFFMSCGSLLSSTILLSGISWIPRSASVWFVHQHAHYLRLPLVLLVGSITTGGMGVLVGLQVICPVVTPLAVVLGSMNCLLMVGLTARMLVT